MINVPPTHPPGYKTHSQFLFIRKACDILFQGGVAGLSAYKLERKFEFPFEKINQTNNVEPEISNGGPGADSAFLLKTEISVERTQLSLSTRSSKINSFLKTGFPLEFLVFAFSANRVCGSDGDRGNFLE